VPWYVKNTKLLRPECRETLSLFAPADAPLRFQRMPTAHLEFSLRQKACRIPEMQPVLFKAVDEGIANAAQFFDGLAQEVEDYCVGDVGTDVDMQAIQSDAILCFSFADILARAEPPQSAKDAVLRLYRACRPQLLCRPFPPPEFRMTPSLRSWPSVAEGVWPDAEDTLVDQYVRWRRQVNNAATAPNSLYAVAWRRVSAHRVSLLPGVNLHVLRVLFRLTTRVLWKTAPRLTRFRAIALAAYVMSFCRPDARPGERPASPPTPFDIDPGKLYLMIPLGGGLRAAILKTRCTNLRGRHVLVLADVRQPDEQQIAGSLEQDRMFSRGCWHSHRMCCLFFVAADGCHVVLGREVGAYGEAPVVGRNWPPVFDHTRAFRGAHRGFARRRDRRRSLGGSCFADVGWFGPRTFRVTFRFPDGCHVGLARAPGSSRSKTHGEQSVCCRGLGWPPRGAARGVGAVAFGKHGQLHGCAFVGAGRRNVA
jgi:hypothetical protein